MTGQVGFKRVLKCSAIFQVLSLTAIRAQSQPGHLDDTQVQCVETALQNFVSNAKRLNLVTGRKNVFAAESARSGRYGLLPCIYQTEPPTFHSARGLDTAPTDGHGFGADSLVYILLR